MHNSSNIGRILAMLSSAALAIAAFLPWASAREVNISGIEGDGLITIAVAILSLIILFIRRIPISVSLILGLVALTISILDFVQTGKAVVEIGGKVGYGVHISILASLGIVIGTIYYWKCVRKEPLTGTIISIISAVLILAGAFLSPKLLSAIPTIVAGLCGLGIGIVFQIIQDKHHKAQLSEEEV